MQKWKLNPDAVLKRAVKEASAMPWEYGIVIPRADQATQAARAIFKSDRPAAILSRPTRGPCA